MPAGKASPGRGFRLLRGGIAAKLYCFAVLSLLAVAGLVAASIYFSRNTEQAARRLYEDGFIGVLNSSRLELLLEHHRRIVESMPLEVDRGRIQQERTELDRLERRLSQVLIEIAIKGGPATTGDRLDTRIADTLPDLFTTADRVAFYAAEFAQDKATEAAAAYSAAAARTESLVRAHRDLRVREAESSIARVSATVSALAIWVLLCALAAVILIGPIGLTTMRSVLRRLGGITSTMAKLARNEIDTQVPSLRDSDEVGEMARAVEVFKQNAVALIARETELKELNRRIDVALNNMTHGLCMVDADRKLIVCNAAYIQMYALPAELAQPGAPLARIEEFRAGIGNAEIASPDCATMAMLQAEGEASFFAQKLTDGRTIAVSQRPMAGGGFVAVHEDITERQRAEARIAHLARHDMLTNLPNRMLFREQLESAFAQLPGTAGFAVHCLDLDHFKTVNDTLGHPIGDQLLKAVAARLAQVVQASDFVARIGGDEFAVVQSIERPEACSELAARIIEHVSKPYDIDGRHIVIGASVGIAIAPHDGADPDQLLKNADLALYLAKGDGRGRQRFFEREMDDRLQARRLLELDLRKAIADGDFELHYQPVIRLADGSVTRMEALLRWSHPTRGPIPPADFIPLAEETGLILPLGEWVLRTACAQAVHWPEQVGVSVNLSAAQFKGRNLVQLVVSALAISGLPPRRLDLEITESVLLQDETNTLAILRQLRSLGVGVSLDDFGTGYSSLAYLRNFPFDRIKIDRSFTHDMLLRRDCLAIIRAVVGLARGMGIATTIEGIETQEQYEAAVAEGCTEGQGYLFSRPIPLPELAGYLQSKLHAIKAA
jgi:diguanylate cyclase (GGDEF)-like protein